MDTRYNLQIEIKGGDVSPETIGAGELASILKHLNEAVLFAAEIERKRPTDGPPPPVFSLVGVKKGQSSDLAFAFAPSVLSGVRTITEAISTGIYSGIPGDAQEELACLSKLAVRNDWSIVFQGDESLDIKKATVSHENQVPPPSNVIAEGVTIVWGHLIRVGGRVPKAVIRLASDELCFARLSKTLAKEVSQYLYEDVGIEGIAKWRARDWKMVDFVASRVTEYHPQRTDLSRTFKELREASDGRWNSVDAREYLKELRSED